MIYINNSPGCFPNTNAKIFEIILIVGFFLTLILLIINLALTVWFFKLSNSLLIIEIVLLVLNFLSIILSIILRIWRSDHSILDKNFFSSIVVAIFNLVIVIINLLLSIVEEVLYSLVFEYITYIFFTNNIFNFDLDDLDLDGWEPKEEYDGTLRNLKTLSLEDIEKMQRNYYRIMDKLQDYDNLDDFGFNENVSYKDKLKKLGVVRIIPWIALNFNILVQFIMFILIIILIGRIRRQSDFGLPQNNSNLASQNRMLGKIKSSGLDNLENSLDSDQKNLGRKKHKKKSHSKKKGIRVNNQY